MHDIYNNIPCSNKVVIMDPHFKIEIREETVVNEIIIVEGYLVPWDCCSLKRASILIFLNLFIHVVITFKMNLKIVFS